MKVVQNLSQNFEKRFLNQERRLVISKKLKMYSIGERLIENVSKPTLIFLKIKFQQNIVVFVDF